MINIPFIDIEKINPINNGRLIFTSQMDVVSDGIELREDGSWGLTNEVSHMMTMTFPGIFNCQDPSGFNELPVKAYMTPGTKIYVFSFLNMTPEAYQAWCLIVKERLGKQGYDWLQIAGQALGLDFLHMPGTEDCSEEGVREMKGMEKYLSASTQDFIDCLSNQSNPQQVINSCFKNTSIINFDGMWYYGGITV